MNNNKSGALGLDLVVQAYGIDQPYGRPAPWIRPHLMKPGKLDPWIRDELKKYVLSKILQTCVICGQDFGLEKNIQPTLNPRLNLCNLINTMPSSNEKKIRVTGPLCGDFTGQRWIPRTKASGAEPWCFLSSNGWVNNRKAGDLRPHRAHYDVTLI